MIPSTAHLLAIWQAETSKLASRFAARFTIVVSIGLGLAAPMLLFWLGQSEMVINGTPLADSLTRTAPMGLQWALEIRNFFLFRILLVMLAAMSFAGEYQSRTLREDLVRPLPRWALLLSKWGALVAFVALCTGATWLVGAVIGLVLFGVEGTWTDVALGYLATIATDAGFVALTLAIAVLLRSVAATIAGVVLFLLFDTVLGFALTVLSWLGQFTELTGVLSLAVAARPWLPSAAFSAWNGFTERADWTWQSFVALGVLTIVCMAVSERVFARTDVP